MYSCSLKALGSRSHESRREAGMTHLRRVRLVHRCSARSTLHSSQKARQAVNAAAWPRCVRKAAALRRPAAFQTWYCHSAKARPTTLQGFGGQGDALETEQLLSCSDRHLTPSMQSHASGCLDSCQA